MLDEKLRVPGDFDSNPSEGSWQLAPDWRFDEIVRKAESDPKRRWFPGREVASGPRILAEQLQALEQALYDIHPKLSCEALEDFWFSADVREFVLELESRLRDDINAKASAGIAWERSDESDRQDFGMFYGELVTGSKLFVWHQLTEYVRHIDRHPEGEDHPKDKRRIEQKVWKQLRSQLRPAREKHGHNQAQAGICLHRDQSTIGRWERGPGRPSLKMRAAIEHYIATGEELPRH